MTAVPTLAHSEGSCADDGWSSTPATGQWRFDKYLSGSQNYDDVYGWSTYRSLFPCQNHFGGTGLSFNAAVNIEDNVAGTVFQIGIIRYPGGVGQFVYADTSPTPVAIGDPSPVTGHRYEFRLVKNGNGKVRFLIYENGTQRWVHHSATSWSSNMKHG